MDNAPNDITTPSENFSNKISITNLEMKTVKCQNCGNLMFLFASHDIEMTGIKINTINEGYSGTSYQSEGSYRSKMFVNFIF